MYLSFTNNVLSYSNSVVSPLFQFDNCVFILGEKLLWFHDSLGVLPDENAVCVTRTMMLELANGYLTRFQEEIDQINLKNSIGGDKKNKRNHYCSRMDIIKFTIQRETDEFQGCGLEMPNLLDEQTLRYFKEWNGELRYVQNIDMKRFRKKDLMEGNVSDEHMEADNIMNQ